MTIPNDAYRDLTEMEVEAMDDIAETLPMEVQSWFFFRKILRDRLDKAQMARDDEDNTVESLLLTQAWSTYYRFTRESEELLAKL